MSHPPVFNQLDLVVRDMDAALRFYRLVGLDIPEAGVWRTATGAHHAEVKMSNGMILHFDSIALTKAYDTGWMASDGAGSTGVIGFSVASREEVDRLYAELVAAGHPARQPPYDAFWGARYAVVEDPDGNHVGFMSPMDPARRTAGPEL